MFTKDHTSGAGFKTKWTPESGDKVSDKETESLLVKVQSKGLVLGFLTSSGVPGGDPDTP